MTTPKRQRSKIAGTCDPIAAKITRLRSILTEAETALARAEESSRAILQVGIHAIRAELSSSSRRMRRAS